MGREIKRVALDFDWPLDKTWEGFLNNHYVGCRWCRGQGESEVGRRFDDFCRRIGVAASDAYRRPENFSPDMLQPRPYRQGLEQMFTQMGRGSQRPRWPWPKLDCWATLLKAAGLPEDWGTEVEKECVERMAMLTIPDVCYEPLHMRRDKENPHQFLIVPGGREMINPFDRSEPGFGIQNYPHPYLCQEDGIRDVGNIHKLAEGLGFERGLGYVSESWAASKAIKKAVGLPVEERTEDDYTYETFDWPEGRCQASTSIVMS